MKKLLAMVMMIVMLASCLSAYAVNLGPDQTNCNHRWNVDPQGEQTCTEGCRAVRYCEICYDQEWITLPALGHNWSNWRTTKNVTCTENGIQERYCLRCGLEMAKTLDKLGHEMGDWYLVTAPTPDAPGMEQRDCVRGDLSEYREIPYNNQGENPTVYPAGPQLVLNGSMGLPNPVLAAGIELPFNVTATNTGNVPLTNIKIIGNAVDANGNYWPAGKYAGQLNDEVILDQPAPFVLNLGDHVDATSTIYIYEMYVDDPQCTFSFVATGETADGQLVTSNVWSCHPEAYVLDEVFLVSEDNVPAYVLPELGAVVPVTVRLTNTTDHDLWVFDVCWSNEEPEEGYAHSVYEQVIDGVHTAQFRPGESFTDSYDFVITQHDIDTGMMVRHVFATGRVWTEYNNYLYIAPYAYTNELTISIPLREPVEKVSVYKDVISFSADRDGYVAGENITYQITVVNNQEQELHGINVYDPLYTGNDQGLLGTIETLGAGDSSVFTFDYTVPETDELTVQIVNVAHVEITTDDDEQDYFSNTTTTALIPKDRTPVLVLDGSMDLPGLMLAAGINLPISLHATNMSDEPLTNIKIYVTAQDENGDKFHFGLDHDLFYEDPASTVLANGEAVDAMYSVYISEHYLDETTAGYDFIFVATGETADGQLVTSNEWSCHPYAYMLDVIFLVTAEDVPAFAEPVIGTVVPVTVRVTNTTQYDLSISGLDNIDLNGMVDNPWYLFFNEIVDGVDTDLFHPGESFTHTFDYVVTQDDLDAGMLVREVWGYGRVWAEYAGQMYRAPAAHSNEQVIVVPMGERMVTVVKTVTSNSKDPSGYALGELISYDLTITNHGTLEAPGINIYDALNDPESDGYLTTIKLDPGESITLPFSHLVEGSDVAAGFVSNMAIISYANGEEMIFGYSNIVTVPVIDAVPMPTVEKIEISHPGEGGYYRLNDEIKYMIRVSNNTETAFSSVYVGDWLNDNNPDLVNWIEWLAPGQTYEFAYSWIVDEDDVARGYVENFATADYFAERLMIYGQAVSNLVVSYTREKTTHDTLPPFLSDGLYIPCTLTLEDLCNEGAMYEQYICHEHQPYAVKAAAATPDEARGVWAEALNEMYNIALAAAKTDVRIALVNEKATFYGYLAAYETSLRISGADEQTINETITKLLKRQCTDLCYLVHTAPDARVDSYIGKAGTLNAEVTAVCGLDMYYATDSDEYYMLNLCGAHSKAQAAVLKSLAASDNVHTLNVWQQATRIWNSELKKLGASEAETATFNAWIRSRNHLMLLVYDADTATEMMAQTIMDRVVELCK